MTLSELYDAVCQGGAVPPSRAKDLKTSIRYLAQALGGTPQTVPDAERLGAHFRDIIRRYFADLADQPSPYTVRNTLNNLSFLYRTAHACGLIPTFTIRPQHGARRASVKEARQTSPYRHRMTRGRAVGGYVCAITDWPPAILAVWSQYRKQRQMEVRETTWDYYERILGLYIGYRLNIAKPPIQTWDELFDPDHLLAFLHWHAARLEVHGVTHSSSQVAVRLTMVARHHQRPELATLQALTKKLPTAEPMHDKQHPDHCVTIQELEDVGLTLLSEAREPLRFLSKHRHPGLQRALRHQTGLILRLLVRVPLRNRNIRELRLGRNLHRDRRGWQLQFRGDELKIRERGGRINRFHIPFPPDLVDHLEEFLSTFRPLIPNTRDDGELFTTRYGRPYTSTSLREVLAACIITRLGKRFYPHLIRTIWTDTYLLATHDISTAAFMLNDRPEMVLKRYHELRANDHVEKAYRFTQSLFGTRPAST